MLYNIGIHSKLYAAGSGGGTGHRTKEKIMKTYEGRLVAGDEKFCIIISRFNDQVPLMSLNAMGLILKILI